jgi:hypothetical protein
MKAKFVFSIVAAMLLLCSVPMSAQSLFSGEALTTVDRDKDPRKIVISDFTAERWDDIVYVNFFIKGNTQNSLLLFQRSFNGVDYFVIGRTEITTEDNISDETMLSFVDTNPGAGQNYYRVLQVSPGFFAHGPTAVIEQNSVVPVPLYSDK